MRGSEHLSTVQQYPRIMNDVGQRRPSNSGQTQGPPGSPSHFGSPHLAHRAGAGYTPPLLTSESTSGTTKSAASSNSANSFAPRTPLEPSIDRSFPMSSLFPSKPLYDTQLPPIRAPSLSPQSSLNTSYNSPSGLLPMDYFSVNSRRGYPGAPNAIEDGPLDPVSALLRAGEIVDRNDQNQDHIALRPPPS